MTRALLLVIAALLAGCSGAAPAAPITTPLPVPTITVTAMPAGDPGTVTFGTGYDPDTFAVIGEKTSFKASAKKIAWVAEFTEPAGATSVTLVIARHRASGTEQIILKQELDIANPASDLVANVNDLALLVGRKPGTYVMRFLREATVLAEGAFTLT